MKTKGSTSYTGVTLGELSKVFKEDAVIEVSKKFLNMHKLVSGNNHISLVVDKEDAQIEAKETQLEKPVEEKKEDTICHQIENW